MEFFRKYQRPILFSAVLFALVTFSVTGPIIAWAESLMAPEVPRPTIVVNGRPVEVTAEDQSVAVTLVQRRMRFDPTVVLPPLQRAGSDDDQGRVLAALRRLAIEYGVEASDDEVDKAIEHGVEVYQQLPENAEVQDGSDLARALGYASYGAYRSAIREALRIANFVRLQALAAYPSDAAIVDALLEDREQLVVRALWIDAEKIEEQIEADLGEVDDEQLLAWARDLDDAERSRFSGPDRFRVEAAYAALDAFDPAAFETELADFVVSTEDVERFYELNKARLFLLPEPGDGDTPLKDGEEEDQGEGEQGAGEQGAGEEGDGAEPPQDDADQDADTPRFQELDDALRERITKRLKAAEVVRKLWSQVQERYTAHMAEAIAAIETARQPLADARAEQRAAESTLAEARISRDEAKAWAERPDASSEVRDALAAAETALAAAEEAVEAAREAADARVEEVREAVDAAVEAAEAAVEARRAEFDLAGVWNELAAGRDGFGVAVSGDEAVAVSELREFPGLGEWQGHFSVNALTAAEPFTEQVQHVADKVFGAMLVERLTRPIKPIDDIRDELRSEFLTAKARDRVEEIAEAVEAALEEKARARAADRIAELEAKRDADLAEQLDAWRTEKQTELDAAKANLAELQQSRPGMRVTQSVSAYVDSLEAELAAEDSKRQELLDALTEDFDAEVEELIREQYPQILAEVAEESGAEVVTAGPHPRDLSSRPRPRDTWPQPVRSLWWDATVSELEADEATELLTDAASGSRFVAVAESVEPATLEQVMRRDLLANRRDTVPRRVTEALMQSFSLDALRERYGYAEPRDTLEPAPPSN